MITKRNKSPMKRHKTNADRHKMITEPSSSCPLLGHHHHPGPPVEAKHQLPGKESTTEDALPDTTEEVQSAKVSHGALLHRRHWAHPDLLHHHLVPCLHCQRQAQTAVCHLHGGESDWLQSAIAPGPAWPQNHEVCGKDKGIPLLSHPAQKLFMTPLWQEAALYKDQNLTPQELFLNDCFWPDQQGPGLTLTKTLVPPHGQLSDVSH